MLRCPRCCRADETKEDLTGRCVDAQTIGCPEPVEVTPGKDVLLVCRADACCKQFAIPATALVRVVGGRRSVPAEVSCERSPCAVLSVAPQVAAKVERQKKGK